MFQITGQQKKTVPLLFTGRVAAILFFLVLLARFLWKWISLHCIFSDC